MAKSRAGTLFGYGERSRFWPARNYDSALRFGHNRNGDARPAMALASQARRFYRDGFNRLPPRISQSCILRFVGPPWAIAPASGLVGPWRYRRASGMSIAVTGTNAGYIGHASNQRSWPHHAAWRWAGTVRVNQRSGDSLRGRLANRPTISHGVAARPLGPSGS